MFSIQRNKFFKLDSRTSKDIQSTTHQLNTSSDNRAAHEPNVKSTFPADSSSTKPKSDISAHQPSPHLRKDSTYPSLLRRMYMVMLPILPISELVLHLLLDIIPRRPQRE